MNTQRQAVVKAVNDLTDSNVPEEFREQMLEAARQSWLRSLKQPNPELDKRRDEVYQMTLAGFTLKEIAEELGAPFTTIVGDRNYLLKNVPDEFREQMLEAASLDKRRDEVYQMTLAGITLKEIAEKLGVPFTTIVGDRNYLLKNVPEEFREQMLEAARQS